jgi:predicted RNA-binding protein with PUA-like domain
MKYWLVKSEPSVFSIEDLRRDKTTLWDGVRNYQARNFLREMQVGDEVLLYHSNAEPPGVAGIATVKAAAIADPSQFDPKSDYYDSGASKDEPRWFSPLLAFKCAFKNYLELEDLRKNPKLKGLVLLKRGNRLSVMPVSEKEFEAIVQMESC